MPTIYREGKYRFFFNSREETRIHVHVDSSDGTAKFWLEPQIELATSYNMNTKEISAAEEIVRRKADDFKTSWRKHFGQ